MMTPKEIERKFKELAVHAASQGTVWRKRLRMWSITCIAFGFLSTVHCALHFGWPGLFYGLIMLPSAVFFWWDGNRIFKLALKTRQEALDEAKSFAAQFGEE